LETCREDNPWISKDVKGCKDKQGNLIYCCKDKQGNPKNCQVDCANFASQALIAGGLDFTECPGSISIGKGGKSRTKGIIGVRSLLPSLRNGFCFEAINNPDPSQAKPGDILSWKSYSHVAVYVGNNKYNAHTTDRCDFTYSSLWNDVILYHFKNDEKCKKCEKDDKRSCKADMKDKCSKCDNCNSDTGDCKPKCVNVGTGRCVPRVTCDVASGRCITNPSGDCPDDTLTVGTGIPSQPVPSTNSSASVGVLEVGFTYDMVGLLQSFKQASRIVKPGDISPDLFQEMPLLVIPSAGLYGMENSVLFKAALDEYVKQGGTIFVLSQQHGYEYSTIPGGLGGYGWVEDQSCQAGSSYIDTWHPVLAGQATLKPSISIDGYFSEYPENSIVLLRRISNGQPTVIMYPYGEGFVIASMC